MNMEQVAAAVFNDRTTEAARADALKLFIDKGADYWTSAVHRLLPVVFAELRKPLYEGVTFNDTAWTAAAMVLDMELQNAIDTKAAQ